MKPKRRGEKYVRFVCDTRLVASVAFPFDDCAAMKIAYSGYIPMIYGQLNSLIYLFPLSITLSARITFTIYHSLDTI